MKKVISILTFLIALAGSGEMLAVAPRHITEAANRRLSQSNLRSQRIDDNLFMFQGRDKGFAIIDEEGNVLAYSETEKATDSIPPAMKEILRFYASASSMQARAEKYAPKLLKTPKFNQEAPFNCYLNEHFGLGREGLDFVIGCTGTAIATVMKYYEWPRNGRGSKSYDYSWLIWEDMETGHVKYERTFSCDFASTNFDWDNILDCYDGPYTADEAEAVGQLCYAAAQSVETLFSFGSSACDGSRVADAMRDYFYFSPDIYFYTAANMDGEEWEARLRAEIDSGRPVIYSGCSSEDASMWLDSELGHAYVLDGYDEQGRFHVNWGWGGAYDGYFSLSSLSPIPEYEFSKSAAAVFNIMPDRQMKEQPRVSMYLSRYRPETYDGLVSDHAYVRKGQKVLLSNFSWRVNGTPFKKLSLAVEHCDSEGKVKERYENVLYDGSDVSEEILSYQLSGFTGHETFVSRIDAVEGDYLRLAWRGDDMTEWKPMGEQGPIKNYCPAYGYELPIIQVEWKNTEDFTIRPNDGNRDVSDKEYVTNIVAGSDWDIIIETNRKYLYVDVLINGEKNNAKLWKTDYSDHYGHTLIRINTVSVGLRKGEKYTMEIITLTEADAYNTPVTIENVNPGELEERVASITSPSGVRKLKIQGRITDTDFYFMRDKMHLLSDLDIKEVSIEEHDYNPENIVPYQAFGNKTLLKEIILPDNLKGFHNNAFFATGLSEIHIPSSARIFGLNVFNSCRSLSKVTIAQATPPDISWCVFEGSQREKGQLIVPKGTKELYQAHEEWGKFAQIIEDENVVDGIDHVITDSASASAPVEYYNLSGMKVEGAMTPGFYIRKQGTQCSKVLIR